MAKITVLAEKQLLTRQQLPAMFGVDAVQPSYDGLGLGNSAVLTTDWLCPEAPNLSQQIGQPGTLPPFNPALLTDPAIASAWTTWLMRFCEFIKMTHTTSSSILAA